VSVHHQSFKMGERFLELREVQKYRELDMIVLNYEKYIEEKRREGARKMSKEEQELQKRYWLEYCEAKEEKRRMEMTEFERQEEKRKIAEQKKKNEEQKIKSKIVNWASKFKKSKEMELKEVEQKKELVQQKRSMNSDMLKRAVGAVGGGAVGAGGDLTGDVLLDAQYEWDCYDYGAVTAGLLRQGRLDAEKARLQKEAVTAGLLRQGRLEAEEARLQKEAERKKIEIEAWERWNNDLLLNGNISVNSSFSDLAVQSGRGAVQSERAGADRERGQKRRAQSGAGSKNRLNVRVKRARAEFAGEESVGAVKKRGACGCVGAAVAVGLVAAVVGAVMQLL